VETEDKQTDENDGHKIRTYL